MGVNTARSARAAMGVLTAAVTPIPGPSPIKGEGR